MGRTHGGYLPQTNSHEITNQVLGQLLADWKPQSSPLGFTPVRNPFEFVDHTAAMREIRAVVLEPIETRDRRSIDNECRHPVFDRLRGGGKSLAKDRTNMTKAFELIT